MTEKTKLIIGSAIGLILSTTIMVLLMFLDKIMLIPFLLPWFWFLDGLISNIQWDGKSIRYIDMS